jgi:VanZ family protein
MRQRGAILGLLLVALALWVGLILFMNQQPPTLGGQLVFLVIFGAAITCTLSPLILVWRSRRLPVLTNRSPVANSLRHAALYGLLGVVLMILQFLRLLNLTTAILLALVVVLLEILLSLRRRT